MKTSVTNSNNSTLKMKKGKEKQVLFDPKQSSFKTVNECKSELSQVDGVVTQKITANATDVVKLFPATLGWRIDILETCKDLSRYNRLTCRVYAKATGYENFYYNLSFGSVGKKETHAPSIPTNCWYDITFELGLIERSNCDWFSVIPFVGGFPTGASPIIEYHLAECFVDIVEPIHELGWHPAEIVYNQMGYLFNQEKIAIIPTCDSSEFTLSKGKTTVLIKNLELVESHLGRFLVADFSEITSSGLYQLSVGSLSAKVRIINKMLNDPKAQTLTFLKELRCAYPAHTHGVCHLNSRTFHPDGRSVSDCGGWHDAGDLSQFEICTAEITIALLDCYLTAKNQDKERYLEEARIGVEWLLRTHFGDGFRALAVLYGVWRPDVTLEPLKSMAENGPFENFLAACALAKAAIVYKKLNVEVYERCLNVALSDFAHAYDGYQNGLFTKRWGPTIPATLSGIACMASSFLHELTLDKKYEKIGEEFADIIVSCQEKTKQQDTSLRGFFYEDPEHKYVLAFEHRGHEELPVLGLVQMCKVFPNSNNKDKWFEALRLYSEYIKESVCYTYPYGVIPGHIYILGKINFDHFTIPATIIKEDAIIILEDQVKAGTKLDDSQYLRIMPIAVTRRGYHATLLSKAKAATAIYKLTEQMGKPDILLKEIGQKQIDWIMGFNPFAVSTMYGVGDSYHDLYVAYTKQLVGALPVGIQTRGQSDLPYWPSINNSVFKEVWGHTSGKFLWVWSDINE